MDAGQGLQGADAAAVEENVPAGHKMQLALLFAPKMAEYLAKAGSQLFIQRTIEHSAAELTCQSCRGCTRTLTTRWRW